MSNRLSPSLFFFASLVISLSFSFYSCARATEKKAANEADDSATASQAAEQTDKYPSACIPSLDQWSITLGDGENIMDLTDFAHKDYFYCKHEGMDWVVFKTPNSGGTTPNSSNTRSELRHKADWTPTTGGKMNGSLKVMHVSTSGDARVAASYSVVIGQIHSSEGHANEPLKIFYKKFPGHSKGSVFWNYEINTEGDNGKRWDYSTAVWGYDMSVVGSDVNSYPEEPIDGIALGEELSYEINVYEGIMYLSFSSEGHPTKTFTKNLLESDFSTAADIPQQIVDLFVPIGRDGTEKPQAYAGELQFFKLGAYNQTNGKKPKTNMIWSTGSETYGGSLAEQYANGSYAEVWVKTAKVGPATAPNPED
ncbi:MAG: polysaccharide lyase family 7 protein [Bacteroidota bacterium]